jgi:hypothetical protein
MTARLRIRLKCAQVAAERGQWPLCYRWLVRSLAAANSEAPGRRRHIVQAMNYVRPVAVRDLLREPSSAH